MAQEQTSLADTVDLFRRRWRLVVVAALSLLAGATLYAERQPLQYEASAIVAVTLRPGQSSADPVRVAAPRFAAYVTAPATLDRVAGRLGADAAGLRRGVDAEVVPDTGNVTITVRHRDPQQAVTVANELVTLLRHASVADRTVAVQVVAPAVAPTGPAGPPRRLIELTALVVGLLLGVGLGALADAVHARPARPPRRPRPPAPRPAPAVPQLGRHPVVGDLPRSAALRTSVADALDEPAVEQAVGALTANLAGQLGRDLRGTIVVTSPGHHQGRTTVARLLAASRLRSGASVLRVDGHEQHGEAQRARKDPLNGHASRRPALEGFAEAGVDWVKDLWVGDDGVWVLPAAEGAMAAAIAEGYAAEVLDEARAVFDCIVVDAPPVLDGDGSPPSRRLLPLADAVLLVLPPDSAVGTLYRSIEAFRAVPAPFVGVVLNRVPRPDRRRRPAPRPTAQGATAAGGGR